MARTKTPRKTSTKSDAIREILKQYPQATRTELQDALKKRGVKASDALINKIKYGRGPTAKRGKRKARRSGASKAHQIRAAWVLLGASARPRDVKASLAARGIKVASAQVSTLRKSAFKQPAAATNGAAHEVPFEHLLAAKGLAQRLGGIEPAREALASLARLWQN